MPWVVMSSAKACSSSELMGNSNALGWGCNCCGGTNWTGEGCIRAYITNARSKRKQEKKATIPTISSLRNRLVGVPADFSYRLVLGGIFRRGTFKSEVQRSYYTGAVKYACIASLGV